VRVASHDLSQDGALLVVDRFDIGPNGERLGFEDVAALLDLRVGGALSDRKYRGSYEDIAEVIGTFSSQPKADLSELFSMVALCVLVRNGDAHLKNFAMLYDAQRCWLAPLYDVVTTTLYAYERVTGERVVDRTMALKLRRGERGRAYPSNEELMRFGREVCGVEEPRAQLRRITEAMEETLSFARGDARTQEFVGAVHREWRVPST
jgi:serine/threonine-protein kinase HipA